MKSLNILILEDNLITATAIEETLENEGHNVTDITRNMTEVRLSLARETPDLAIVDIRLEDSRHSGIEIVQNLLKHHPMPIIYLTAETNSPLVEEAMRSYPAAYMIKPFRAEELIIQVELAYINYHLSAGYADTTKAAESVFLPTDQGRGHIRITKKDVVYMRANGAYVEVFIDTDHGLRSHMFSMNLGHLVSFFPPERFFRISRSLVVNLDCVERIEKNQLYVGMMEKPLLFSESSHRELLRRLAVVKTP